MALVVEDGTGLTDSESYVSVAAADAYFAGVGNTSWPGLTETQKEQCLRVATDYIDRRFSYYGCRKQSSQAHEWPRYPNYRDNTPMPAELIKATCEYAVRAAQSPLDPDPEYVDSGQPVLETETEIGGAIKERVRYQAGAFAPQLFRNYPAADGYLLKFVEYRQLERS